MRFKLRSMMAGIAVGAILLALVRISPILVVLLTPLIGSIWEMRKGGEGILGGAIAGTIMGLGGSLFVLYLIYFQSPQRLEQGGVIISSMILAELFALGGAVIGLIEGMAFRSLTRLAPLFRRSQLGSEQDEKANAD